MTTRKQGYSLVSIIVNDLYKNNKLSLLLVALILISAIAVLLTTHQVRLTLNQRERLSLERDVLENEWRNLILEENVLADEKRIERNAVNRLRMQNVTQKDETVIVVRRRP